MTVCFDVEPAAHCDFLPAAELSVQCSLAPNIWRCLTLPSIVLLFKAPGLRCMVVSVLFSQIKREPACGDSLHTVEVLSKVLLATTSPYLGSVLSHIFSEIRGFAFLKLLLLVLFFLCFPVQFSTNGTLLTNHHRDVGSPPKRTLQEIRSLSCFCIFKEIHTLFS